MFALRFKMFSAAALALTAAFLLSSITYAAPLNSGTQTVNLSATLNESLSLSITGGNVSFSLTNGTTSIGGNPVVMTTSWVLAGNRTSVKLYGSFANAAQALNDGITPTADFITSANVLGQVSTGAPTTYAAFTQTNAGFGGAGAGLLLFNQAIGGSGASFVANRTDNLNLEIATPATLPAGTYTGTITIQAQAN